MSHVNIFSWVIFILLSLEGTHVVTTAELLPITPTIRDTNRTDIDLPKDRLWDYSFHYP